MLQLLEGESVVECRDGDFCRVESRGLAGRSVVAGDTLGHAAAIQESRVESNGEAGADSGLSESADTGEWWGEEWEVGSGGEVYAFPDTGGKWEGVVLASCCGLREDEGGV